MDALFDYLIGNNGNMNEIKRFRGFLNDEEFDSDVIQSEIQCTNILEEMKSIRNIFKKFMLNFRCMFLVFFCLYLYMQIRNFIYL